MTGCSESTDRMPQPAAGSEKYQLIGAREVNLLVKGRCADVFARLGMHPRADGTRQVSVFLPGALEVEVVNPCGKRSLGTLRMIHEEGLFSGCIDRKRQVPYRLKVRYPQAQVLLDDPYRFPSLLDDADLYLFANGTQEQCWRFMGANPRRVDDVDGILFVVWAPNARRVSLVSAANHWDGRVHVMRLHPQVGVWEIFIPDLAPGTQYKYEILTQEGNLLPLKADPYARSMELRPATASRVSPPSTYQWQDYAWLEQRHGQVSHTQPVSIYEVHLGSWRRHDDGRYLNYRELAEALLPYVQELGFTHIQCLPLSEFPFDGSWGYQPLGLYAPTSRFGTADDLRYFIDRAHQLGIGVLLDWVPGHFPTDSHGLARFDGSHLYEHADPRQGFHPDWNTCIYNYGRAEVQSYLISNALYWFSEFHCDGLRCDAVASMLYLDYSRKAGEWVPNRFGGRENIEAIDLLRSINARAYFNFPGVMMVAEESTAWPGVTRMIEHGGLGFGFKWNMGWMNDTLRYLARDPVHRRFHHNEMTFGLLYGFSENFILPLSHDEVVHGKRSLLGRIGGNDEQKFATLRTYYLFMWTHPGKKLLFMGGEFAQHDEWRHDHSLDWHLTQYAPHAGMQHLIRDLNQLYRQSPALYELDCSSEGFEWLDANDYERSLLLFRRKGRMAGEQAIVLLNFTPMLYTALRVGVPQGGWYRERLNTNACEYGGSGDGNLGGVHAEPVPAHGLPWSIVVRLPGLAGLVFSPG